MSFEMQSKLAIISFSLRVSQASRRGSKISRGRSPPWPDLTISNARCTLSRSGAERFASLEAAIVSSAEEMSTTETVLPLDRVSERLCAATESVDCRAAGPRPLGVAGLLPADAREAPLTLRGDKGMCGGTVGRRATGEAGLEGTGLAGGVGGGAPCSSASATRSSRPAEPECSPSADLALFSSMGSLRGSWAMMPGMGSSWGGGDGGRGMDSAAGAGDSAICAESGGSMAGPTLATAATRGRGGGGSTVASRDEEGKYESDVDLAVHSSRDASCPGRRDRDPLFSPPSRRGPKLAHSYLLSSLFLRVRLFLSTHMSSSTSIPVGASAAVLKPSEPMPDFAVTVEGPNFDEEMTLQKLIASYQRIGFQANSLGKAIDIVNKMVRARSQSSPLSPLPEHCAVAKMAIVG